MTSANTDGMCRTNSNGTAVVGISASGSSVSGSPEGVMLTSWYAVRGQGHDQIGDTERVEPQGGAAARALREPTRDQRRSDTGGDVAQTGR
jgi:hypothetical protein